MVKYPTMSEVIAECVIIGILGMIVVSAVFIIWANVPH
jgi:hypothetical protein